MKSSNNSGPPESATPPPPADSLKKSAKTITDPAGRDVAVLFETEALQLARLHNRPLHAIYLAAMENGIWPARYIRNRDSLNLREQKRLAQLRAAVIGAGGLGGYIIELLARIGFGYLTIVDPGRFDETNLNRQILADSASLGKNKVAIAASRAGAINAAMAVDAHAVHLNCDNAPSLLHACDIAMDALDNMETRAILNKACRTLKIPLVHGAISGFEGRVMAILPDDPELHTFFDSGDQPSSEAVMGTPAIAPAVIASLQVMESLKIVLNRGRLFRQKMLYADLENGSFNEFNF